MMTHHVKRSPHIKLLTPWSQQRKDFFLFFFCDSKNHLDLDQSTTDQKGQSYKQINMVAPGRTETSLAGWWGKTVALGPSRDQQRPSGCGLRGVAYLFLCWFPTPSHSIRGDGFTPFTPATIKWIMLLSVFAKKRQLWFHFSYIELFLIGSNQWSQYVKSVSLRKCFFMLQTQSILH